MPIFINPPKDLFSPEEADYKEIARYLGYRKSSLPDFPVKKLIEECAVEMYQVINPKGVYDCFELGVTKGTALFNPKISFSDVSIESQALFRNLEDCKKITLMAATIGPQVDAMIRRYEKLDSVKAAVLQSAGAMFVEKLVDYINHVIIEENEVEGLGCRPRFSPGYGDVSLSVQKDFFRLLPCSKIGLTLMDTLIMAPEKSVTAFIGSFAK